MQSGRNTKHMRQNLNYNLKLIFLPGIRGSSSVLYVSFAHVFASILRDSGRQPARLLVTTTFLA